MNNFKLSTRLTALIGFLSLLMIVIGAFGRYGISESNRRFKVVYEERLVALGDLLEVQRLLLRNRNAVSGAIAVHLPEYTQQKQQEIQTNINDVNKAWASFRQTRMTEEEAQLADRFEAVRALFLQGFLKPAQQALLRDELGFQQQVPTRGCGLKNRDPVRLDQSPQGGAIDGFVVRGEHDGGAHAQWQQQFEHCDVKAEGGDSENPVALFHAGLARHAAQEIHHRVLWHAHALGSSGRARGVDEIGGCGLS